MKTLILSGGTGSAKLLRGFKKRTTDFAVVANVGDNIWMHALYVCPDLDIIQYALSGLLDKRRGWGVAGDTFNALDQLRRLGEDTWFKLGDKDLAVHILRTELLRRGMTLTAITEELGVRMGVGVSVFPPTDTHMETHIITSRGEVHLQDFWVRRKGRDKVTGIKYVGSDVARPTEKVLHAIEDAQRIIICPANPVTSIGPMLAIKGLREALSESKARKLAVSPMVGKGAFSGPAAKFMRAIGIEANSYGVAKLYSSIIDTLVVDRQDSGLVGKIKELGIDCLQTRTLMRTVREERALATFVMRSSN